MTILTKDKIFREISKGNIKIEPFVPENVGPASIDLNLGNKFRIFKNSKKVYDAYTTDYQDITELKELDSIIVKPGETILGVTLEKVTLSPQFCGWLEGRSRFARLGLMVHISAPFMQPGISNHPVLEIANMGHVPLRLHAGTPICQFIFEKAEGKARYTGKFREQEEP
jgi:dCTP deaminase